MGFRRILVENSDILSTMPTGKLKTAIASHSYTHLVVGCVAQWQNVGL